MSIAERFEKKPRTNEELRVFAKEKGVAFSKVAEFYGVAPITIWRLLRKELPADEQEELREVIEGLAKGD